jgi:hypothetical protein
VLLYVNSSCFNPHFFSKISSLLYEYTHTAYMKSCYMYPSVVHYAKSPPQCQNIMLTIDSTLNWTLSRVLILRYFIYVLNQHATFTWYVLLNFSVQSIEGLFSFRSTIFPFSKYGVQVNKQYWFVYCQNWTLFWLDIC